MDNTDTDIFLQGNLKKIREVAVYQVPGSNVKIFIFMLSFICFV